MPNNTPGGLRVGHVAVAVVTTLGPGVSNGRMTTRVETLPVVLWEGSPLKVPLCTLSCGALVHGTTVLIVSVLSSTAPSHPG